MRHLSFALLALCLLNFSACENASYTTGEAIPDSALAFEEDISVAPASQFADGPGSSAEFYDKAGNGSHAEQAQSPQSDSNPASPSTDAPTTTPKIIYTADVRMQVENLESAVQQVKNRVTAMGGYLSSQHLSDSRYTKAAELRLRLPVAGFQSALDTLISIGTFVDYQNLDSRNVTAEWVDLESRLKTKREVRDRYVEILRNRARKVEDILEAEEKIRIITEEIEAKEGRLRYLRDQVQMSTVTLNLYETQEYQESPETFRKTFAQKAGNALAGGWQLIQNLLLGMLSIWPLLLLLPLLVWGWRRLRKGA